ncbi:hypothetical protein [Streptomyces candidus]|uniref:ATP-binding protein n=1 Tax=Streptomyces candidus TaxID=67283 RepID=A0A7X0HC70_9ACTN|nr:hypothetical protein [Streptomyces candidus]MBB6434801.1 hypothetical protein [Streptomyces candidus]GHH41846.1 hypothetical protein GCM10018773_25700 [Streptomyces candidus]
MKRTKAASVLAASMVVVGAGSSSAVAESRMPASPSTSAHPGVAQVVGADHAHSEPLGAPIPLVDSAKGVARTASDAKNAAPGKLLGSAVGGNSTGTMLGGLPLG